MWLIIVLVGCLVLLLLLAAHLTPLVLGSARTIAAQPVAALVGGLAGLVCMDVFSAGLSVQHSGAAGVALSLIFLNHCGLWGRPRSSICAESGPVVAFVLAAVAVAVLVVLPDSAVAVVALTVGALLGAALGRALAALHHPGRRGARADHPRRRKVSSLSTTPRVARYLSLSR
jgi:hypothetical protein